MHKGAGEHSRCSERSNSGNRGCELTLRYAVGESAIAESVQCPKPGASRVPCAQRSGARGPGDQGEARSKNSAGARKSLGDPANRKCLFGVVPGKDPNPDATFRTLSFTVD